MEKIEMRKAEEVHAGEAASAGHEDQKKVTGGPKSLYGEGAAVRFIPIETLRLFKYSPRSDPRNKNNSLIRSIKQNGVENPLMVMPSPEDNGIKDIIDGGRRLEAARQAGLTHVPCIVVPTLTLQDAAHLAYRLNDERKSWSAIEKARHIQRMKKDFNLTGEDLYVEGYGTAARQSQLTKLLDLAPSVQKLIENKEITTAHGSALSEITQHDAQIRMAERVVRNGYSAKLTAKKIAERSRKLQMNSKRAQYIPNEIDADVPGVYFKSSENMAELPDESVHLVVTSPPYGLGMEFELGRTPQTMFEENKYVLDEIGRVVAPGCYVAVNIQNIQNCEGGAAKNKITEYFYINVKYQQYMRRLGFILQDEVCWVKDIPWHYGMYHLPTDKTPHAEFRFIQRTEQILIFKKKGKREDLPSNDIQLQSRLTPEQLKAWLPNVWNIPVEKGLARADHPCVYPQELCSRLIQMFSYIGDTVLDPWLGSGTTVKVARDLNRIGIGYERELKYKTVIMKKLGIEPVAGLAESKPFKMIEFVEEQLRARISDKTANADGHQVKDKNEFLPDLQDSDNDSIASDSADQYFCSYV